MAFHPEKRTTLPVTRAREVLKYPYQLHGHILETTDSAKYLGVTINKDLGWNTHINNIYRCKSQQELRLLAEEFEYRVDLHKADSL